uniref:Uncharacterized protein n=1 Tax=Arundo donax TaxID=35708 RepID=A0A0A9GE20_ARUDO
MLVGASMFRSHSLAIRMRRRLLLGPFSTLLTHEDCFTRHV